MRPLRALLVSTVLAAALAPACRHAAAPLSAVARPPESPSVVSSGSVPPGFYATLTRGGIEPDSLACNSQNRYSHELRDDADAAADRMMAGFEGTAAGHNPEALHDSVRDAVFWWMVRAVLVEGDNNNLGAIVLAGHWWTDDRGIRRPVVVFRTAFTPDPAASGSCYSSLLAGGGVRHVVNLYDGEMVVDDLVEGERRAAAAAGASYVVTANEDYGTWRAALREEIQPGPERDAALADLARLINDEILSPGGKPPRGNILIHCGGGMHRSGMVTGILQKAVNHDPWPTIEAIYRYHVGYRDEQHPGGFEPGNLDVIRDFDPKLLQVEEYESKKVRK